MIYSKEFMELMITRCDEVEAMPSINELFQKMKEVNETEGEESLRNELISTIEVECYKKGFMDAMSLVNCSQKV